jgi:diphthine-ammonia ligase
MKVVALVSGGKDSCYNMVKCVQHGHEIVCLANLAPRDRSVQELDSWCFQTVGHNVVHAIAECMGVPLYQQDLNGTCLVSSLEYHFEENEKYLNDEVEDLFLLLKRVKNDFPDVSAISCGAIFSEYQRNRVENVCSRLGLVCLAYLWRRDQSELLNEMIQNGMCAVMIKTASMGLNPKRDCGKTLAELRPMLEQLKTTADLNVCGEGGEYETFTLDCPIFKKRIVLDKTSIVIESDDEFAPVGHLLIEEFHLEDKNKQING